jgi:hypothetical protein
MEIRNITIDKPEYGVDKGTFRARVTMKGGSTYPADVTIQIPDEMLKPIVDIVAQATVETMKRSTEEMKTAVAAQLAGPAIEQPAIASPIVEDEAPSPAPASDDDMPF